ncbi:hypothetical protein [Nocardia terpenica]|uniref:MarR family transcriptional regulator n=1 Tax=Nocardia terpenica TaxID=455432 RepID=A0A291RDB3_9NOCA|nr:hypothetical protein [Nocardia terpenica]ATL65300.1 hypothetical protein CRH09_02735 [Nocardia terpenica]
MAIGQAAESAVLNVLAPGGMLTAQQISNQAELTGWATRHAIEQLAQRGLIMPVAHRSRWSITARGRLARAGWTGGERP